MIALTTSANAPGVNTTKQLAFSRHTSLSANKAYQRRGNASEVVRLEAFGWGDDGTRKRKHVAATKGLPKKKKEDKEEEEEDEE